MAARKDMMRILRQDAGFSAKLEFGGQGQVMSRRGAMAEPNDVAKPKPETDRSDPRDAVKGSPARSQIVYVAVSLTATQAAAAEVWAAAAKCSVPFLIRRVAQNMREGVFAEWERDGMPPVDEARGARGRYPTSVTMTLRPAFAARLSGRHDPHGIMGLARVMGPAFRARFEKAFDETLAMANIHQPGDEGDTK